MRVCLTVHGEQPISLATSRMSSGGPRSTENGAEVKAGDARNALGCAKLWPSCIGQALGQRCPRERDRSPPKLAELRALAPGRVAASFSVDGDCFLTCAIRF